MTVAVPPAPAPVPAAATGMVSAPGQLYYGESNGLYTPISDNQIIERHGAAHQPQVVVVPTQSGSAAPVVAPAPASAYPAQAYAQTYPGAPAHSSIPVATPIVVGGAPVPPPQPVQLVSIIPPIAQTHEQLKRSIQSVLSGAPDLMNTRTPELTVICVVLFVC